MCKRKIILTLWNILAQMDTIQANSVGGGIKCTYQDPVIQDNTHQYKFPWQDPRVNDFDETELILLLSEIRNMLNNMEFDEILWEGDINADFMRRMRFARIIEDFINEMNIYKSWVGQVLCWLYPYKWMQWRFAFTSTLRPFRLEQDIRRLCNWCRCHSFIRQSVWPLSSVL